MLLVFLRHALPLCLISLSALSQATFPLTGTVTNATTGEPIPRARVVVTPLTSTGEAREIAFTDLAGAFRFPTLPAGKYSLFAQKPRFKANGLSPGPPIDLSGPLESLPVPLVPYGVIAGQVADAGGQPLRYVRVDAYRQVVVLGYHQLTRAGTAATDDRGNFRIWDLPAGRYFVRAMSRAGGTFSLADESAPSTVGRQAFAPVYAGGFERLAEAIPTDLAAGQQARADFRLPNLPAYRVRGTVTGLAPALPVRFELRRFDTEPTEPRTFFNPATGVFTMFDLLPGAYQLHIRQGERSAMLTAEAPVKVGPGDVAPILLEALPPTTLTLRSEGPGTFPCTSLLIEADKPLPRATSLNSDIPERVPPGEYHVLASCSDAVVERIRYGRTEILESSRLTIPTGAPPAELTVTRSTRSGILLIARQGETARSPVLLLPGQAATGAPRLLNDEEISARGLKLLPGKYTLHALRDRLAPFRDPAFLGQFSYGSSVQIENDQTTQVVIEKHSQP